MPHSKLVKVEGVTGFPERKGGSLTVRRDQGSAVAGSNWGYSVRRTMQAARSWLVRLTVPSVNRQENPSSGWGVGTSMAGLQVPKKQCIRLGIAFTSAARDSVGQVRRSSSILFSHSSHPQNRSAYTSKTTRHNPRRRPQPSLGRPRRQRSMQASTIRYPARAAQLRQGPIRVDPNRRNNARNEDASRHR